MPTMFLNCYYLCEQMLVEIVVVKLDQTGNIFTFYIIARANDGCHVSSQIGEVGREATSQYPHALIHIITKLYYCN